MKLTSLNNLPEEPVSHNPQIKKKVMLRFGDLPHLTNFSQSRFAPGQTAPAHTHQDMCEVFFVESGSGFIRINSEEYPLVPGNCIAIEPGEVHEVVNNGSTELVLTYFGLRVEKSDHR
ncbi:cupin [Nostocales cyanobacterium HT-58-2]|nr:cupin [Nostocales cyanobacterium HT-58-2]